MKALQGIQCIACNATGQVFPDPGQVPYGDTYVQLPETSEPCPDCGGNGYHETPGRCIVCEQPLLQDPGDIITTATHFGRQFTVHSWCADEKSFKEPTL